MFYANTLGEEESEPVYAKAVENLKEALDLLPASVPEALAQFVKDWESGQGEGEGEGEGAGENDEDDDEGEEQDEDEEDEEPQSGTPL